MKTLRLELPDELHKKLSEVAVGRRQTVEELVAGWLAEYVRRAEGSADMETRAKRADFAAFDRVIAKVPHLPPMPGDELPEGYERIRPRRDAKDAGGED